MNEDIFKHGDLCIYHEAGSNQWQVVKITGSNNGVIPRPPQFHRGGGEDFGPGEIAVQYLTDPKVAPYMVNHVDLRRVTEKPDDHIRVAKRWAREIVGASRFYGKSLTLIHLDMTVSEIGPQSS